MTSSPPAPQEQPHGQWLRTQRQARGWTIPDLRHHLRQAAARTGDTLPGNELLAVMIRRWEHDDHQPAPRYRHHISRALGIPPHTYGTTPPPATANPAAPPEDSTTPELARLRRQHAELHARHRELKRSLIGLLLTATDDTCDPG